MTSSNDRPEKRLELQKTYLWFAIIFGLTAQFAGYIIFNTQSDYITRQICEAFGNSYYYCYFNRPPWWRITLYGLVSVAVIGAFRFYFLAVMKKYSNEGLAQ